jgi:hypothetical protein
VAKAKAKSALYIAQVRRNEVDLGVVEVGQAVDLSGWTAEQIAWAINKGFYAPDGPLPEDVQTELDIIAG